MTKPFWAIMAAIAAGTALSAAQDRKDPENSEAKPTPAQKGRQMLDAAAEMVASARPEVQAAALMHLGDNFEPIDKRRALEFYRQAFSTAGAIDDARIKLELQAQVSGLTARLNVSEAVGMLKMMPSDESGPHPRRHNALYRIVQRLAETGDLEQAIVLTGMVGSTGPFPLRVLNQILEKLPAGDYRCGSLFATAVSAFRTHPQVEFGQTIARHWKKLPPQAVDSAVKAMVDWVLERKETGNKFAATISTEKGTATFASERDYDLFDLMHLVRQFDPKRGEELLMMRPALRVMVERFPEGRASMGNNMNTSTSSGNQMSADEQARMQLQALAFTRASAARTAMKEDPQKALDMIPSIPLPEAQAELLGQIASSLGEKDPEKARSVLSRAAKLLTDVKEPRERIQPWLNLAQAAHRINDAKGAWDYLERAMDDAVALYRADTSEKAANMAIREEWPSTQYARRIVTAAAKLYSVDAEPLLVKITDPEIALLVRIEMAQALLGRPASQGSISVSRVKK